MSPAARFWAARALRRLPLGLAVFLLIGGAAVTAALLLPPTYASSTQITVAAAEIPDRLTGTPDTPPPLEQLQLFQQRLLTRANLLAIAAKLQVFADQQAMTADRIVDAMTRATTVTSVSGRDQASLMTIRFEARTPALAAAVVNEYLTLILQDDARARADRARQTLDFFTQEVTRLAAALDAQARRILAFKHDNAGSLPENLGFLRQQQADLQDRIAQAGRETALLIQERDRLVQVYATTGSGIATAPRDTPEQRQMAELQSRLGTALAVYSRQNPRVKMLQAQIDALQKSIDASTAAAAQAASTAAAEAAGVLGDTVDPAAPGGTAGALVRLQLADIKDRLDAIDTQKARDAQALADLAAALDHAPATGAALEALQRDADALQTQYATALASQSAAAQAARAAALSRGERITVIAQPELPTDPVRPRRALIAAAGLAAGLAAALALAALLEALDRTIRRPEDLTARLGLTPLATLPLIPGPAPHRARIRGALLLALPGLTLLAALGAGLARIAGAG